MKHLRPNRLLILILCICFFLSVPLLNYVTSHKAEVLRNPIVQRIIPMYHSIRKIPDALFIPASLFTQSKLPKYEIFIKETQNTKLNFRLGPDPFDSLLEDENKVWVRAEFRSGDYRDTVKIKYRGQLANHWNSYKKSYTIKFPKDNLFQGMKELSLVIPVDRLYFSTSLNNQRARNMDQLVPEEFYVRLSVNGSSDGVMLAKEQWSQEWIEKNPVSSLSTLYGLDTYTGEKSMYSKTALPYWKSWNQKDTDFSEVRALIELLQKASDDEFERMAPLLIDLESFYAKDTVLLLTGGYHTSDDGNNIVLLFDATEGRFKTIPYNAGLIIDERNFTHNAPLLQKRIWNIPSFKKDRDAYFNEYVSIYGQADIAFVDSWINTMKTEFFRDNAKLENNFMFKNKLDLSRQAVEKFLTLSPSLLTSNTPEEGYGRSDIPLTFSEEFEHLKKASQSINEFLKKNWQFKKENNSIILPKGNYYFTQNIIIPINTRLIIKPGTTLYMDTDVSLISYSPITMQGTQDLPINIRPVQENKVWGSIAVLNTEKSTSTISYTNLTGGSELRLQGIQFSGMLALHNANGIIIDSSFNNAQGGDAVNIKGGMVIMKYNKIDNTFSDGLDLDYVSDNSIISYNTFSNIGGDAIDISWTNAPISNNIIETCTDKGISIGERSSTTISFNTITNCSIGIAVKDQSTASIKKNNISRNKIGLSLYQKKDFFGGATATLNNNIFILNKKNSQVDYQSVITNDIP